MAFEFGISPASNMVSDFLTQSYRASNNDFNPSSYGQPMGGPTILNPAGTPTNKFSIGSNGNLYQKLSSGGYINTDTGQKVGGISTSRKGGGISYSSGPNFAAMQGGGMDGMGGGGGGSNVDFYLGPAPTLSKLSLPELVLPNAPTLPNLDLGSVFNSFRSVFNTLNSGVNPEFGVDSLKLAKDAKDVASKLNYSPEEIKSLISAINPSTGEIISDVEKISSRLNDPAKISQAAGQIADSLNAKYQSAFAKAMPGYEANMAKANKLTTQYLSGNIPQDVVDSVVRGAASKGFATGLFGGGIGRNMVARDLGLTSLQLQATGANLLQQTASIANSVLQATMPVSGESFASRLITDPNQIFSTVANMRRVDPNTIFNAVYTPNREVYNTMSQMAQQSTMARANFEASKMVAPASVFSALTTQAQYNQQINAQNLLNQWETMKTMATQNNAIQGQQAIYNNQIEAQNAINKWQTQGLPGQYDVQKGQYIGFTPGTYSSTPPQAPGYNQQNVAGGPNNVFNETPQQRFFRLEANYLRNYRV
jgi:hypothetical protein